MIKLFIKISVLAVSFVTVSALAQDIKGDAKAGESKNAMCSGCHSIKGYQASFPEVHKVPMIAGQSAKYITSALNAYKKGERKHPSMRGIAETLSEQDIADLAAYFSDSGVAKDAKPLAEQPSKAPNAQVLALLTRDKANCASCHGANFSKPIDPSFPKLGGQHADYLLVALKSYKIDSNAKVGRGNAIMAGVLKKSEDEMKDKNDKFRFTNAELKLMANYLSSLEGDLKIVPQSVFRTSK